MSELSSLEVTNLLLAWRQGEKEAFDKLVPVVYEELHHLAHNYMRNERKGHVLQTTALVNEAYLRLMDCGRVDWQNRSHFLAICAQLMRRILVDYARSQQSKKRGGTAKRVSLEELEIAATGPEPDLIEIDEALQSLAQVDERKCRVVELRFFGGLTAEETAEVLKISPDTVLRDWKFSRAWLARELKKQGSLGY